MVEFISSDLSVTYLSTSSCPPLTYAIFICQFYLNKAGKYLKGGSESLLKKKRKAILFSIYSFSFVTFTPQRGGDII